MINLKKEIICDSSSLISLTDSCLVDILYNFTKNYNTAFIIPIGVENEIIKRPLSIKMKAYQFSALRLKKAINDKILLKVNANIKREGQALLNIANNIFFIKNKPMHLIDLGEAEMIALAHRLNIKTVLMDERTTRMLMEAPFRLKEHLEQEINQKISIKEKNYSQFTDLVKNMKVIRSVDLLSVAYSVNYFDKFNSDSKEAFIAALYKLKYSGCSVGFDEIDEFLKGIENARSNKNNNR